MSEAGTLYVKGIYDRFSYLATWLPNTSLVLGDVGFQEGGYFKRMTTLKELGIPFKVRSGKKPVDFTYTSQSGITFQTKAAGEVAAGTTLPLGQAGIVIEFNESGAFLFQAIGCRVNEIEDKEKLGQAIIQMYREKTWDGGWSVVDTLVKADSVTIVVSNSQQASLELSAKTPLAITNLANVEAGLTVNSQQGDMVRFLAAKGLMPLFKLSRIKKSLLASLLVGPRPIYFGGKSVREDVFEAVEPE